MVMMYLGDLRITFGVIHLGEAMACHPRQSRDTLLHLPASAALAV